MMNNTEFERMLKSYKEYDNMIKQIKEIMDGLKDDIIAEMTERGAEKYTGNTYSVSYIDVCTHPFDTKRFKTDHAEIAALYTKTVNSKRFTVK